MQQSAAPTENLEASESGSAPTQESVLTIDNDRRSVAFAYQPDMLLHVHRGSRHKHPECPERVAVALEKIRAAGLLEGCRELCAREATDTELLRVHTPKHLTNVAAAVAAVASQPDQAALHEPQGDGVSWARFESIHLKLRCLTLMSFC